MLKLVVAVVAIALPDCINPSLIGGELLFAAGPHARRRTTAFTLGAWLATFAFGVVFALGLGDLILSFLPTPSATVKYALIAVAGLVLVLGGLVIWIRRRELTRSASDTRTPRGSPGVIGAGIAGLELLTAFPYFAAIAMIVGSGVSDIGKLTLLVVYCIVYTLPLILIAAVLAVAGERGERRIRPVGDWLFAHWPALVAPLTAVIGFVVLVFGVVQLA